MECAVWRLYGLVGHLQAKKDVHIFTRFLGALDATTDRRDEDRDDWPAAVCDRFQGTK